MTLLDNRSLHIVTMNHLPVVTTYLTRLDSSAKINLVRTIQSAQDHPIVLTCFTLDWTAPSPGGFTCSTVDWEAQDPWDLEYQYDLRKIGYGRKKAYRVPFLTTPQFHLNGFTVSHLCHLRGCLNPAHHVLESLEDNKGRNGCGGPGFCFHQVPCLIPGPFYRGQTSVVGATGNFTV